MSIGGFHLIVFWFSLLAIIECLKQSGNSDLPLNANVRTHESIHDSKVKHDK